MAATMEHRHFKIIADTIATMEGCAEYRADIAETFADKLACTNPRFDRKRFLTACAGTPCNGRDVVRS